MDIQGTSVDNCLKTRNTSVKNFFHPEKYLCANHMTNTSITEGHHDGSGFVFKHTDSWFV